MKSWSNWLELSHENVKNVPEHALGVYVIRRTINIESNNSDIIYIGSSGNGNQGVGKRLKNLVRGLSLTDDTKAKNKHAASPVIRQYIQDGLQFSWIECLQVPDGVEKAFLLAFWTSNGGLPICNKRF